MKPVKYQPVYEVKLKEPPKKVQMAIIWKLEEFEAELSKEHPYKKEKLMADVNNMLHHSEQITDERKFRLAIQWLRMYRPRGSRICTTTGRGGGYYLAKNIDEQNEFMEIDRAQVRTMCVRWNMQYKNALEYFEIDDGDQAQMKLFDIDDPYHDLQIQADRNLSDPANMDEITIDALEKDPKSPSLQDWFKDNPNAGWD